MLEGIFYMGPVDAEAGLGGRVVGPAFPFFLSASSPLPRPFRAASNHHESRLRIDTCTVLWPAQAPAANFSSLPWKPRGFMGFLNGWKPRRDAREGFLRPAMIRCCEKRGKTV